MHPKLFAGLLVGGLAFAGVLVGGLALAGRGGFAPAINDHLYFQSARGVTVVRAGAADPTFRAPGGVPSRDWSTVVKSTLKDASTEIAAFIPTTGTELWARDLPGRLRTKVVSEDGNLVALSPVDERYWSYGRRETRMTVIGSTGAARYYSLRGNYEPEAFSTDGSNLFVVRYLPARDPSKYQVRRLDLSTGKVHEVYTPDAHLQTSMRGTARVQAASSDGRRLYTLYTLKTPVGTKAFIHVLSLDELWAHCIDLPDDFVIGSESAAITVTPDGRSVYAVNGATGAIAEIDPQSLAVERTGEVDFVTTQDVHAETVAETLFVSSGKRLTAVDLSDLIERRSWMFPANVKGIQAGRDGRRVYVAIEDKVLVLDAFTGERLKTLDPPGVHTIRRFGKVPQRTTIEHVRQAPSKIVCAC